MSTTLFWTKIYFIFTVHNCVVVVAHVGVQALIPASRGHGGRVITLWPPTSEAGVRSRTGSSGKAGSCLPLVGSLQYTTLANSMYWFPLPFQLPVVIWPVQC